MYRRTKMMNLSKQAVIGWVTGVAIIAAVALLDSGCGHSQAADSKVQQSGQNSNASNTNSDSANPAVDLSPSQLNSIKVEPVGTYQFPIERETVGTISFPDDLSVQVFPAYQGTIIKAFVELGAQVEKDQPLYTIKSPDLI
ncbi:MAG: hypothetical protein WAM39_08790, partial [Bryobacteraceae bacterium]